MENLLMLWAGGAGALFFGVGLVLILTAWERCQKNLRSQGNKMTRPVAVGCCLVLLAVSAFVLQRGYSGYKDDQAAAEAKPPAKSLGFTVAEFKDRFNDAAKRVGVQRRVEDPVIAPVKETDTCETFQVVLGENLGLIGSADKQSHALDGFTLFMSTDDDALSQLKGLAKMLVYSMALVEMCNPGVTSEQRDGILRELGLFIQGWTGTEKRDFGQGKDFIRSNQLDQVRYSFRMSPGGRAYLTAQPL